MLKNWRPIALALTVYKLWTSVVSGVMSTYAEERGVLHASQEGFRKHKNTLRQINRVLTAIEDARVLDKDLHVLYIDFENAFGSPDHGRMMTVMEYLGFPQDVRRIVGDLYPGDGEGAI